jgi:hypothetical protein
VYDAVVNIFKVTTTVRSPATPVPPRRDGESAR